MAELSSDVDCLYKQNIQIYKGRSLIRNQVSNIARILVSGSHGERNRRQKQKNKEKPDCWKLSDVQRALTSYSIEQLKLAYPDDTYLNLACRTFTSTRQKPTSSLTENQPM